MPSRRRLYVAALALLLAACAARQPSTVSYIERGQVQLAQDSVVARRDAGIITAELILPTGARRQIALSVSECKDGVGSINILNEADTREHGTLMAFANGDRVADALFVRVCELGMRKPGGGSK